MGWDGAAALLASAFGFVLGLSVGGAGLLPLIPDWGLVALGYGNLARICLVVFVAGATMAVLRSGRISPGRELGRDAVATPPRRSRWWPRFCLPSDGLSPSPAQTLLTVRGERV